MKYIIHSKLGLSEDPNISCNEHVDTDNHEVIYAMQSLLVKHGYSLDHTGKFQEIGVTILEV